MGNSVKWIKLTTDIFDDDKIKCIDSLPDRDAILVIWIKLLTLAGKCNSAGCLLISQSIPYTDEMLAAVFSRPLNTIRLALDVFEKFKMIERHDVIKLVNWEKHQSEAKLEIIRERDREAKKLAREKQKLLLTDKMSRTCPGQVSDSSISISDSISKDSRKDNNNGKDKKDESALFDEGSQPNKPTRAEKPKKIYGTASLVSLTDDEYAKFVETYGEDQTRRIIDKLDSYKQAHGTKYKSDAGAIRQWVIESLGVKEKKPVPATGLFTQAPKQRPGVYFNHAVLCPACGINILPQEMSCRGCGKRCGDFEDAFIDAELAKDAHK